MRNKKAFLSCVIVAAASLLGVTPAMATFCTSPISGSITVISLAPGATVPGACPVVNPAVPECASQGGWTGIQYQITGGQASDLVSTLVSVNNTVVPNQIYAPGGSGGHSLHPACTASGGGGDPNTGLGQYSCHERAVKVKVTGGTFWILVKGTKQPIPTSIVQKRGLFCPIKSTSILGLGLDLPEGCVSSCGNFAPSQTLTKTEIVKFKGCEIQFTRNLVTGAVLDGEDGFQVLSGGCTSSQGSVADLEVVKGTESLGAVSFGDGALRIRPKGSRRLRSPSQCGREMPALGSPPRRSRAGDGRR